MPDFTANGFVYSVKNPSNAQARFEFQVSRHYRQNAPEECVWTETGSGLAKPTHWRVPLYSDVYSLTKKDTSGPGVVPGTWTYTYPTFVMPSGFSIKCQATPSPCPLTKKVLVNGPSTSEVYDYGIWWGVNDGQLISHSVGPNATTVLSKSTNTYVSEAEAASLPFGVSAGGGNGARYDYLVDRQRPVRQAAVTQDGVTFKTVTNTWDVFARPLSVTRSSTLPGVPPRTDVTSYHDNLNLWVTGQVASVTNTDLTPGKVLKRTSYNSLALPYQVFSPRDVGSSTAENAEQTFQYYPDGNVKTVADGLNNIATYSSWKRGVPELIQLPGGGSQSALVASDGTITWVQGEGGDRTCYAYDNMGRTRSITHTTEAPSGTVCDTTAWNPTTQEFVQAGAEFGLPAGHWRQSVTTDQARTEIHFDAFWRPVVERTWSLNGDSTATFVVKRYDALGRLVFQSYPVGALTDYRSALNGVTTAYDALGRPLTSTQNSELGDLVTTTLYLPGFQTRVTDPEGNITTTGYFAQGEPSTEQPAWIDQPEGVYTTIRRDVLGNPTKVTRSGPGG